MSWEGGKGGDGGKGGRGRAERGEAKEGGRKRQGQLRLSHAIAETLRER